MSDPARLQAFQEWFVAQGGYLHPSAEAISSTSGNALFVRSGANPIEPDSAIIACPRTLTLSFANIRDSPSLSKLIQFVGPDLADHTIFTRLFLVDQYLLGEESMWWPYIRILPRPDDKLAFNTPLWFEDEDLLWLQGTNLGAAAVERKAEWKGQFEQLEAQMRDIDSRCWWTWELYVWAATVLSSRGFPSSAVSETKIDSPVLIPGLDLLNHSPWAKVAWEWNIDDCTIRHDDLLTPGCEIFNNYGPKRNEELLMGYGFCLPNNAVETFGLGFSKSVSRNIEKVKNSRRAQLVHHSLLNGQEVEVDDPSQVAEQHWLRLRSPLSSEVSTIPAPFRHEFSPAFLEHFSIALENPREQQQQHDALHCFQAWDSSQQTVTCHSLTNLTRNKFHVLNSLIMLLEKSKARIQHHDKALLHKQPSNQRQQDAATYRFEQLKILTTTLAELTRTLKAAISNGPTNGILRLQHILTHSPKPLLKDFRNLLHTALGTRDAEKIKQRHGVECAFTLCLCGLCLLDRTDRLNDGSAFASQLKPWLRFLSQWYGDPASLPHPTSSGNGQPDRGEQGAERSDEAEVARSYLEAIRVAGEKHPKSLYRGDGAAGAASVSVAMLEWCLHVVREEGVRCPAREGKAAAGATGDEDDDDEYVLFLDRDHERF